MSASWVIVRKLDGEVIFETFSENVVRKLNTEKYTAIPILEYLVGINKDARLWK